ncbi:MAG: FtsX-like permease family protein, partial [Candidatus Gallimonas sp.]
MGASLLPAAGDLYIAFSDRNRFDSFSKDYKTYVAEQETLLAQTLGESEYSVVTLYDNYSFHSLHSYGKKVMGISLVLMVAFLFITALVVLSNMTRLMEEERSQIACLRTLGYSAFKILFKYVLFSMLATGIGGAGAYFVGIGLASLVYYVFNYSYVMPPMSPSVLMWFYLVTFFVIVGATLVATLLSGARMMREKPAALLRPKPPKSGKKVILERIPLIWNRLSFRYKSTMRNVLRYMSRFIMTVVAVAGSMGLVLAGLALLDMCLFGDFGSPAIMGLAIIVVFFAGLLTAVVIYTLTNINISERNREIATLMVLGYHDNEVAGYIYREIYINTAVGILFGYPAGLFIMWFVFTVVNFGSIATVSWFVWLIAPLVTLLFTFLVTLLLRRKIVKIDMNESLKAIE